MSGGRPLRIGLEANELCDRTPSGLTRYVVRLLEALRAEGGTVDALIRASRLPRWPRIRANGGTGVRWVAPPILPPCAYDILHLTAGRTMRVARAARTVATVHDLWEHRLHAEGRLAALTTSCHRLTETIAAADGVVCISQATADDFRRFYPDFAGPVAVAHHGISTVFQRAPAERCTELRARLGLGDGEFLVYVGHYHNRKNVPRLIEAYARLGADAPPLVLAGNANDALAAELDAQARSLGVAQRVRQIGYVSNQDLPALMSCARLMVFVTLYEGFGFPLLEAYGCGTPVVASNTSSLIELAHPLSPLVDPQDPDHIAAGIRQALARPPGEEDRAALIAHARSFTWARCAQATLALYRQVLAR